MKILAILICCAAAAAAQTAAVPRLGWVSGEEPGRIHEVVGVAGAAQLGPPLALCDARVFALRPGSNVAAVVRSDGSAGLLRLRPGRQDAGWQALAEAVARAETAAWSPLGSALVLASAASERLQVWLVENGLLRLGHELPLAAVRAAVSDAGTVLAEIGEALYRISPDGSMTLVSRQTGGPFTFLAGSERYAWLEESVVRLEGGGVPPAALEMDAEGGSGLILFSVRGAPLGVVQRRPAGSLLTAWNADGEKLGAWELPAAVLRVAAAGPEGVVHLVTAGGPIWMASFESPEGRIFFVPGVPAEGEPQ